MAKRYRLLKPIITMDYIGKVGSIGELREDGNVYFASWQHYYKEEEILKWPEWFEEIKEPEHTQEFVWDDLKVEAVVLAAMVSAKLGDNESAHKHVEDFKSIYRPASPDESKVDGRDWEIIDVRYKPDGKQYCAKSNFINFEKCLKDGDIEILSVKRLSDGEVFSVGDEVKWDLMQLPGQSQKPFIINSFEINDNFPEKRMYCNNQNICIKYLQKTSSTQTTQQPEKPVERTEVKAIFVFTEKYGHQVPIQIDKYKECVEAVEKILNKQ